MCKFISYWKNEIINQHIFGPGRAGLDMGKHKPKVQPLWIWARFKGQVSDFIFRSSLVFGLMETPNEKY